MLKRVRAKFYLNKIEESLYTYYKNCTDGENCSEKFHNVYSGSRQCLVSKVQKTLVMNPQYNGTEEDKLFWACSPGGELRLNCVLASAIDHLELGKSYYIEIVDEG